MAAVRITLDGFNLIDPAELAEQIELADDITDASQLAKFVGKANSYRCQSGRNPGIGWVLVTKAILSELTADNTFFK